MTKIRHTAKEAPNKLDTTSNSSAERLVVKYSCINSIATPKTKENRNEYSKSFVVSELLNFFLKNKNQRKVNTK